MQRRLHGYEPRETAFRQRFVDKILVVVARGDADMGQGREAFDRELGLRRFGVVACQRRNVVVLKEADAFEAIAPFDQ